MGNKATSQSQSEEEGDTPRVPPLTTHNPATGKSLESVTFRRWIKTVFILTLKKMLENLRWLTTTYFWGRLVPAFFDKSVK